MYLLHGFFFQEANGVGLGRHPEFGTAAVMRRRVMPFMFAAAVWRSRAGPAGVHDGMSYDEFGTANLYEIVWEASTISFRKLYTKYKDLPGNRSIQYEFRLEEGTRMWVGTWEFPGRRLRGIARCQVSAIPDEVLQNDLQRMVANR